MTRTKPDTQYGLTHTNHDPSERITQGGQT